MSILKLKPRLDNNPAGIPAWHDALALQAAIDFSSRGKPMSQLGVVLVVAGKIQAARAQAGGQINPIIEIELSEGEGRVLWEAIGDLAPEAYWGRTPNPPILTIKKMLDEIKEQLDGES